MIPVPAINWIDAVVVFSLLISIFIGIKTGALGLITVVGSFYATIFLSGWLLPKLLPIDDRALLTVVTTNIVVTLALVACTGSVRINKILHLSFKKPRLKMLDTISGGALACLSTTIFLWLLLPAIIWMPFVGLSNMANQAFSTQLIRRTLPITPAVITTFNSGVNPNNPPYLFYDRGGEAEFSYDKTLYKQIANLAASSVVNITGLGCGGQVSGTGFVTDKKFIITNAHVVAGLGRPIVKLGGVSYEAIPILFEPNLDFAVLQIVEDQKPFLAPSLQLKTDLLADDSTVAILGYPDGRFTASPGVLHENRKVFGRNIYDIGYFGRSIYAVQTEISGGSSGGPVIAPDGKVAGVIFGKDDEAKNIAYALDSTYLISLFDNAKFANKRVGVGACFAQ